MCNVDGLVGLFICFYFENTFEHFYWENWIIRKGQLAYVYLKLFKILSPREAFIEKELEMNIVKLIC